jgi:hypothetical protein
MYAKTRKATFNLHPEVIAAMDKVMAQGAASSKNVLVERAIIKELKELQRKNRKARWEEGAKDPFLLKDIEAIGAEFQAADAETARGIV